MRPEPTTRQRVGLTARSIVTSPLFYLALAAAPGVYFIADHFSTKPKVVDTRPDSVDDTVEDAPIPPRRMSRVSKGGIQYRWYADEGQVIDNNLLEAAALIRQEDNYGKCNHDLLFQAGADHRNEGGWWFITKQSSHPDASVPKYWEMKK